MKIIITGGAGFVGSSLCLSLKKKYPTYKIVAFDNLKRRGSEFNISDFQQNEIGFIHGDIRCKEDFDQIGGFDVLIDASAEPSVMAGISDGPASIISNNLYGSVNCFEACLKENANLIFLSTSRVYPINAIESAVFQEEETRFSFSRDQNCEGITNIGINENLSLYGARSFYGSTKLASEFLIQEYSEFYGMKASVIRYGVIAGPRQMGKTDQGVVTLWLAKHFWKQKLAYIGYGGKGKQVRDILHIDDLVELVDLQLHKMDLFVNRVYNAGGGLKNSVSLLELSHLCSRITGNVIKIDSIDEQRPADLRAYITDYSLLSQITGWEPKRTVEQTVIDIYTWILNNENKLVNYLK